MLRFEKSLQDLVKGIRNSKNDPSAYISKAIQEIKEELKSRDMTVKAQALSKLTYLNMMGHDMSWAAFHVIEVMSQERFALKRIGFLAASQSFTASTDVLVLCTQLLKKELQAKSQFEIGLAINTLANIATEDLSRDLLSDVVMMLTSSRPYIRKKATLVLYKIYLKYPQGLRLTFDNLQRRLTDETPSVVSCAVNVICELARKKPSNYLRIAPDLFNLLTNSSNNWMLIKVAKLMSALVQEEPRLARKLLEPLANIVQTTSAKSLMYECISTITFALQHTKRPDGTDAKNAPAVVRLCTDRLREMIRDPDQNLKYLGLVGLVSLMRSNPRVVAEHRELVLTCLADEDVTIRLRALELITGMVTRRNLQDIVKHLMELLETAEGHFRDELIEKVIFMCSRDKYAYLADFTWYIGVLSKLAHVQNTAHSTTIAGQLLDVAVRVEDIRGFAVQHLLPMLADADLAASARLSSGGAGVAVATPGTAGAPQGTAASSIEGSAASLMENNMGAGHVLYAAAWIVGEYCGVIPANLVSQVLDALLQPASLTLPAAVQGVYVQASLKLLTVAAATSLKANDAAGYLKLAASVLERLHPFAQSVHVEVQERACLVQQLLATLGVPFTPLPTPAALAEQKAREAEDLMNLASADAGSSPGKGGASPNKRIPPLEPDLKFISTLLTALFAEPLKPVNPKAQKRVPVPEGLDLDKWISKEEEKESKKADEVAAGTFRYTAISFEDGIVSRDDEYAGGLAATPLEGGMGDGHESDDDAWLKAQERKNRKYMQEKFAISDKRGHKKEKEKEKEAEEGRGRRGTDRSGDPYYLKSSSRSRGPTDVDDIPIKEITKEELKPGSSLANPGIFGDFGKKKKKEGKKGKKGKPGSDEDEPASGKKAFRVLDDDDMPEGAAASDDDARRSSTADALSKIDITSPLRDDEQLPTHTHRTVNQPGMEAGKKGRGRARHLPGSEPTEEEKRAKESKKGGKKEEKDKDKDKGKEKKEKGKDKPSKEEKKEKGKDKPSKEEKKKTSKKDKDKDKDSKAASKSASAPSTTPSKPTVKQGEEYATGAAHSYRLVVDKVLSVRFTVAAVPVPAPAAASAAEAAPPVTGTAAIAFRVESRSSKKSVDWVDVEFAAPFNADVIRTGLTGGATPGAVRLGTGLKEKSKSKVRALTATIPFAIRDPAVSLSIPVRLSYLVTGASAPTAIDAALLLRSAAILVPTVISTGEYRELMTTGGGAFTHAIVTVPVSASLQATFDAITALFRSHVVATTPKQIVLYARATNGGHATAALKASDDSASVAVTIKSVLVGHAAVLANDVTEALAAAAAEEKEKD